MVETNDGRDYLYTCSMIKQNFLKGKTPNGIREQANFLIHLWENEDMLWNFQASWSGVHCRVSLNNQMMQSVLQIVSRAAVGKVWLVIDLMFNIIS